jgi:hypothetical protein
MIHERRKGTDSRHSELPLDYTQMVTEVFISNFADSVESMKLSPAPVFIAKGEIYSDEIVVHISLVQEGRLAGTTAYASSDFDPKASSPSVEDLLGLCVDALGDLFQRLFELAQKSGTPALVLESNLQDLGEGQGGLPLEWTQVEVAKRKIHLKLDRANPALDQAADQWLAKNDPEFLKNEEKNLKDAEKLFVLPPKKGEIKH